MNTSRILRTALIIALGLLLGLLSPLAAGAAVPPNDDPGSPVQLSEVAIAGTLFEVVFNGDGAPGALLSADAVIHTPYGEFTGPEGLSEYLGIIRRAYPDASFNVSSISLQGDTAVVRWTMSATQYQIGPTDPKIDVLVTVRGETAITVADGQIADLNQTRQETTVTTPVEFVSNYGPTE